MVNVRYHHDKLTPECYSGSLSTLDLSVPICIYISTNTYQLRDAPWTVSLSINSHGRQSGMLLKLVNEAKLISVFYHFLNKLLTQARIRVLLLSKNRFSLKIPYPSHESPCIMLFVTSFRSMSICRRLRCPSELGCPAWRNV